MPSDCYLNFPELHRHRFPELRILFSRAEQLRIFVGRPGFHSVWGARCRAESSLASVARLFERPLVRPWPRRRPAIRACFPASYEGIAERVRNHRQRSRGLLPHLPPIRAEIHSRIKMDVTYHILVAREVSMQ